MLNKADFWNDRASEVSNSVNTRVISMKNLSVLTNYVRSAYGKNTRVIITEVGFNYLSGEKVQAAALALGYYIAACDPMVDAFIILQYEKNTGSTLDFGIRDREAYDIYCNMDTSKGLSSVRTLLAAQAGAGWQSYVPGYSAGKLASLYRIGSDPFMNR